MKFSKHLSRRILKIKSRNKFIFFFLANSGNKKYNKNSKTIKKKKMKTIIKFLIGIKRKKSISSQTNINPSNIRFSPFAPAISLPSSASSLSFSFLYSPPSPLPPNLFFSPNSFFPLRSRFSFYFLSFSRFLTSTPSSFSSSIFSEKAPNGNFKSTFKAFQPKTLFQKNHGREIISHLR